MLNLPEIKRQVGIDNADTSSDDLLYELEVAAVSIVETLTNRKWGAEQVIQTSSGGKKTIFLLNNPDLQEAFVVRYIDNIVPQIVSPSNFTVVGSQLINYDRWYNGYQNVEVTYTTNAEVPAAIKQAVMMLISAQYFNLKSMGGDGLKSESIGGYSYTKQDTEFKYDTIAGFMNIINSFRRRNI